MGACFSYLGHKVDVPHTVYAGRIHEYNTDDFKVVKYQGMDILVAFVHDGFYAIGGECSHARVPLKDGAYDGLGRIYCPAHGACFDFMTGALEEFPGFDNVPTFRVSVHKGGVYVHVKTYADYSKFIMAPLCRMTEKNRNVTVIGTGAAGYTFVQTLRQEGFPGQIVMITMDKFLPYDKTLIAKLLGVPWDKCNIRHEIFYTNYDIEVIRNATVSRVSTQSHLMYFEDPDREPLSFEYLLVASGQRARKYTHLKAGMTAPNVMTFSCLEDSHRLRQMAPGKDVVILGHGFTAMELASSLWRMAKTVTLIGVDKYPLEHVFGRFAARWIWIVFTREADNVYYLKKDDLQRFQVGEDGYVTAILTKRKMRVKGDVFIVAIGALPNTDFLDHDKTLIMMDKYGHLETNNTSLPDIYAAGDVALFPLKMAARDFVNVPHWSVACTHGKIAAIHLVHGKKIKIDNLIPFYWTTIGSMKIRYVGHGQFFEESYAFGGRYHKEAFCVLYSRFTRVLAALCVNCDPVASALKGEFIYKKPEDVYTWPTSVTDKFTHSPFIKGDKRDIYWKPFEEKYGVQRDLDDRIQLDPDFGDQFHQMTEDWQTHHAHHGPGSGDKGVVGYPYLHFVTGEQQLQSPQLEKYFKLAGTSRSHPHWNFIKPYAPTMGIATSDMGYRDDYYALMKKRKEKIKTARWFRKPQRRSNEFNQTLFPEKGYKLKEPMRKPIGFGHLMGDDEFFELSERAEPSKTPREKAIRRQILSAESRDLYSNRVGRRPFDKEEDPLELDDLPFAVIREPLFGKYTNWERHSFEKDMIKGDRKFWDKDRKDTYLIPRREAIKKKEADERLYTNYLKDYQFGKETKGHPYTKKYFRNLFTQNKKRKIKDQEYAIADLDKVHKRRAEILAERQIIFKKLNEEMSTKEGRENFYKKKLAERHARNVEAAKARPEKNKKAMAFQVGRMLGEEAHIKKVKGREKADLNERRAGEERINEWKGEQFAKEPLEGKIYDNRRRGSVEQDRTVELGKVKDETQVKPWAKTHETTFMAGDDDSDESLEGLISGTGVKVFLTKEFMEWDSTRRLKHNLDRLQTFHSTRYNEILLRSEDYYKTIKPTYPYLPPVTHPKHKRHQRYYLS